MLRNCSRGCCRRNREASGRCFPLEKKEKLNGRGKRRCESRTCNAFYSTELQTQGKTQAGEWNTVADGGILSLRSCSSFFAYLAGRSEPGSCRRPDPTRLTVALPSHTLPALPQASRYLVSQLSASSLTLICNISCAPFIIHVARCVVCCSSCMN